MKPSVLLLLSCFVLVSVKVFAQSPQAIEADLLHSFKKIDYWDQKRTANAADSLTEANDRFGKKLKTYTEKYPATINAPLGSLKKARLDIFTSADNLFRIYSWETWEGGTMRDFANVMQYKTGQQTKSILLRSADGNSIPFYSNLYTFKTADKTYYLGIYGGIYSTKDARTGIQVFSIENGKLNADSKLLKTGAGLRSKIYYDYDFFSVVDIQFEKRPTITFNAALQTIYIPLVDAGGKVTNKFITYKFTGQYFEKVKSK